MFTPFEHYTDTQPISVPIISPTPPTSRKHTERYRAWQRAYKREWNKTPQARAYRKAWLQTEAGQAYLRRHNAARRQNSRNLGL